LVNDADLDWYHIADEIESVGQSELRACRSLLRLALLHMLKAQAWPRSSAVPGWRAEAIRIRHDAAEAFTPSMRQRIDVAALYARAAKELPESFDGTSPALVPAACPMTLDELLGRDQRHP
jgi:hypothetical protein